MGSNQINVQDVVATKAPAESSPEIKTMNMACTECQRRKQKCSRRFPCDHCLKRGVSHLCHFLIAKPQDPKTDASSAGKSETVRKRGLEGDGDEVSDWNVDTTDFDASAALTSLGYAPGSAWMGTPSNRPKSTKDDMVDGEAGLTNEMREALREMPPKPYTDLLVDNWLSGANYHYYALYPAEFRAQYNGWWTNRQARENVSPALTSLILRVCSSSAQFLPRNHAVKARLEVDLNEDLNTFARRLHDAAIKLNKSILPGQGGLLQVQQLFLTAYWWKAEEGWVESWHALAATISMAYEIGLHKDANSEGLSEFDREMRRRVWILLFMWDYAMSSLLSRPSLIKIEDCDFVLPSLSLESDPQHADFPSPFFHVNIQAELWLGLDALLKRIANTETPLSIVMAIRDHVTRWVKMLPPVYALENPKTQWDQENPWIIFQRRYLHMIGYMTIFNPLKPYLTVDSSLPMTVEAMQLRTSGVTAGIELLQIAEKLWDHIYPLTPRFHYAVFCMFDTATVLCSALVHDTGRNLPQREKVFAMVMKTLQVLEEVDSLEGTTTALCQLLKNLVAQLKCNNADITVGKRPRKAVAYGAKTSVSVSDPKVATVVTVATVAPVSTPGVEVNGAMPDGLEQGPSLTLHQPAVAPLYADKPMLPTTVAQVPGQDTAVPHGHTRAAVYMPLPTQVPSLAGKVDQHTSQNGPNDGLFSVPAPVSHGYPDGGSGIRAVDTSVEPLDAALARGLEAAFAPPNFQLPAEQSYGGEMINNHGEHDPMREYPIGGLQHNLGTGSDSQSYHGMDSLSSGMAKLAPAEAPPRSPHGLPAETTSASSATLYTTDGIPPDGTHSDCIGGPIPGHMGDQYLVPFPSNDVDIFGGDLQLDQDSYRTFVEFWNWQVLNVGNFPYADASGNQS